MQWKVGDVITFSGSATDNEDGSLPPSALSWSLIMHHCPSNCHTHPVQDFPGVASGSFAAPDHEYPSWIELTLSATDSGGLRSTVSLPLNPQTVQLTFQTSPTGLQLAVGPSTGSAPFTRTVIVGSSHSISAPSPQSFGGQTYQFAAWSDGGGQTHNVTAPAAPTQYTASFTAVAQPTGPVAAYGFSEGSGTTATDVSGNLNTGTVSGATWTAAGKYGSALIFDGVNDRVTVPDAPSLDLTTALTLEAWVYPTGAGGWRTVLLKEMPNALAYVLYQGYGARMSGAVTIGGTQRKITTPSTLPVNTWTHLAMTYDGATLRLFVNAVEVSSLAAPGAVMSTANPLSIGGNSVWNNEWFAGRLDEIRIYNRALTPAQIQTDMKTPVGGTPNPDTTPPTVKMTAPAHGAFVGASVSVAATATDTVGVIKGSRACSFFWMARHSVSRTPRRPSA